MELHNRIKIGKSKVKILQNAQYTVKVVKDNIKTLNDRNV